MIKFCKKCQEEKRKNCLSGYSYWWKESETICPYCGNDFINIDFPANDLAIIEDISEDVNFIEAMIELRKKDIIEYESRMSQFRTQVHQQEQIKNEKKASSVPHCPHCNSTNIKPISTGERVGSIAMWGVFSKKINKSFKCNNCGYTW